MNDVYEYVEGDLPLLISVPHDGRELPQDIAARMTTAGRATPDTDWDVAKLYEFAAAMGATVLVANFSRYVVDLNRAADGSVLYPGQLVTGLCPQETFAGDGIYRQGNVGEDETAARVAKYWRPYHDRIRATLDAMRVEHGFALLWDAHSIPSVVPRLFDGELPLLNLGSNNGASCGHNIENAVWRIAAASSCSAVCNGRFTGGFITRHYGDPENRFQALQLEIAQRAYMDEEAVSFDEEKAQNLRNVLKTMLHAFLDVAVQ